MSPDAGATRQRSDGKAVELPVTAESADVLAAGGVDQQRALRAGAMAVDPQGRAHVVYAVEENERGRVIVARPNGDGSWQRIDLHPFLPSEWSARPVARRSHSLPGTHGVHRRGDGNRGAATLVRLAGMLGWLDLGTLGSSLAFRVGVPAIVFVVSFVFIYRVAGRRVVAPKITADMSDEQIARAIRGR